MPFKSIAALSFAVLLSLPALGAEPSLFTPLPAASVSPLQGKQCACALVSAGSSNAPPAFDAVLASVHTEQMRVVMNGRELVLPHVRREKLKSGWLNTYGRGDARLTVSSRPVPFAPMCARHPDPPSEGSCYVGELVGSIGPEGRSQSVPFVQICGC